MARRSRPTPVAHVGLAIAVAAFGMILALGFSGVTVPNPTPDAPSATAGCGSVFGPEEEALCDEVLADRKNLILAIGIPGVVIGLGIIVVSSRLRENRR